MMFDVAALFSALPPLLGGLVTTIYLVLASLAIGIVIGVVTCVGRILGHGPAVWMAKAYIDIFRGLPETILIFWVYFCGPIVFDTRLSAFESGVLALCLATGAYLGEIFRAGILAVPKGQTEAAKALGLTGFSIAVSVVIPQAIRLMLPAFFSLVTILIKNSGIVSAVGVAELFYTGSVIAGDNFKHFEVFTAVGLMYFLLIFPFSLASRRLEARLAVELKSR